MSETELSKINRLEKVGEGGTRELLIDNERKNPKVLVKVKSIDHDTSKISDNLRQNLSGDPIYSLLLALNDSKYLKDAQIDVEEVKKSLKIVLEKEQELPKQIFGKMYIPPRFINVTTKDDKFCLVTHEKYRPDLYPSGPKKNVVNLCRVFNPYLGMPDGKFEGSNYSIASKALFGEKFTNYKVENNPKIQKITESEESVKAINKYLNAVENYKNSGFRLDLAGGDNVVLANYDDGYSEVVINNSAVKIERIDTLSENLRKVLDGEYDGKDINEIMNQVAGMVNINILCDMVNRPRVFVFDAETEIDLKEVLMGWGDYYIG